jgi:hypothetical protein
VENIMPLHQILALTLFAFALVACEKALEALYPVPQIVDADTKNTFLGLGDNESRITIQNTGAAGAIYIRLQNQNQRVEQSLYFDKGERRTVVIRLPDSFLGEYRINVVADELKDELKAVLDEPDTSTN